MGLLKYEKRSCSSSLADHWGQRKLFLSELYFLVTQLRSRFALVIYAGSAPGHHLKAISTLFPDVRFICYDPLPTRCKRPNVKVIQKLFTDDDIWELRKRYHKYYFISDIRTPKRYGSLYADSLPEEFRLNDRIKKRFNAQQWELICQSNMHDQQRWVRRLSPVASMLKFRLPYSPGNTNYLEGDLMLPVWGGIETTECRLIVGKSPFCCDYSNDLHEKRMSFFNRIYRSSTFQGCVPRQCWHGRCFDCTAEHEIIGMYLNSRFNVAGYNELDVLELLRRDLRAPRGLRMGRKIIAGSCLE
jgi:hypothetical protein